MYESRFKNKYTFSERILSAINIKEKFPDKLPIICEKVFTEKVCTEKIKFLVPKEFTVGNFIYTVKRHLFLDKNTSIFMFVNNNNRGSQSINTLTPQYIIPRANQTIRQLYNEYRDDDLFLYIKYCNENTFGN